MSRAESIVVGLLEGAPSAKDFIAGHDDWDWYEHDFEKRIPPEMQRRSGEGHDHQWELVYNNWLFTVSTYEDGISLWSAYYKTPRFFWSHPPEHEGQTWDWGGGAGIERVPARYNLNFYLSRLKKMADANPDVWKSQHVPHMPDPESITTYGY